MITAKASKDVTSWVEELLGNVLGRQSPSCFLYKLYDSIDTTLWNADSGLETKARVRRRRKRPRRESRQLGNKSKTIKTTERYENNQVTNPSNSSPLPIHRYHYHQLSTLLLPWLLIGNINKAGGSLTYLFSFSGNTALDLCLLTSTKLKIGLALSCANLVNTTKCQVWQEVV